LSPCPISLIIDTVPAFICLLHLSASFFFLFNPPPPSEFYTLSLHDALPILLRPRRALRLGVLHRVSAHASGLRGDGRMRRNTMKDRKSTRLNSSHVKISYAVFCLKKKKALGVERLVIRMRNR